ncbi:hypothetical protein GALL_300550 [mine drainage metagenome]|uniref:Uncharacterized protein n=1 Tax=mine drainage metagenome TaxID=410659 RepID=A0A1J5QWV7_9ZZZZ
MFLRTDHSAIQGWSGEGSRVRGTWGRGNKPTKHLRRSSISLIPRLKLWDLCSKNLRPPRKGSNTNFPISMPIQVPQYRRTTGARSIRMGLYNKTRPSLVGWSKEPLRSTCDLVRFRRRQLTNIPTCSRCCARCRENRCLLLSKHDEPIRNVGRMVLSWMNADTKLAAEKGGAKLGNKLFHGVGAIAEPP